MKILVIASLAESLLNFRGHLLSAMTARGFEVHVAAPGLSESTRWFDELKSRGYQVHDIALSRAGTNPWADFRSLLSLWKLMRQLQPDAILCYTVKPVIYGTIAGWLAGIQRRFALITGLGYAFTGETAGARGAVRHVVQGLYRFALTRSHKVFFQNPDDQLLFRQHGLLRACTPSVVVNGSGVDLERFAVAPLPVGASHFLLIARLLGDKGIREYAQAAQRIRAIHQDVRFSLVGWIDENPDAITQAELDAWIIAGDLVYIGRLEDVRPAIAACSVYVLPSYREGTPRTVLEAMAMGRPIITTHAPGCRETVAEGENGFLVPVRSVDALVEVMQRFIQDSNLASRMGKRSRELVEEKYDVHKVNAVMLKEMGL
jgi:glycosyltransferase involved in cell wall biosynthesis